MSAEIPPFPCSSLQQRPVIIVEPWPDRRPRSEAERTALLGELRDLAQAHPHTRPIQDFLIRLAMPVNIRHNAKIFREQLAVWATGQVSLVRTPQ